MDRKYGQSQLWEHNINTVVTEAAVTDLSTFKSSGLNFKLALWDPRSNGLRYLKTLVHTLAAALGPENWARMRRIRNRHVGAPISVIYDGELVCVDYLMAVHELEFMAGGADLDGMAVLEIGAGYGRTCHAMMSNHDIASYDIVDLESTLPLSRAYLREVLDDEQFARIGFHSVNDVETLFESREFDLCVNIDSFAEMPPETVLAYLEHIATRCRYLYVNNPVGKYLDKSLDGHCQGDEVVAMAMATGLLRDIIDIHNSRAVRARSGDFVTAYRPARDWHCVAEGRAVPWTFYWQALYRREDRPA
ncbi:MAG: putative sugar O-methyltransferase [Actinophytocola sp.]|uniref:putative sugar O-methyltransferase n=1 Tax=Actinophytocola sp. TaxID=1872138 RepID=UPI003C72F5E9